MIVTTVLIISGIIMLSHFSQSAACTNSFITLSLLFCQRYLCYFAKVLYSHLELSHFVPLPLLLSIGLLPMIHMTATVVLKQKETSWLELFLECQRNNYLYVGHVLRVWFEGMPAAIGWPGEAQFHIWLHVLSVTWIDDATGPKSLKTLTPYANAWSMNICRL